MVGNAHIDPVWLWRWEAGVDEALASFRAAADRCDEYAEFVYTRGESGLYGWVERLDPGLFARVRALVERGQWAVTGGQYVQPDANAPTELGLRRQLRHGRRYFADRFGVRPTVGYNVDTFGHPATLPDILASEGYGGYVFHRPHPSQVELPAPLFRWRGTAGGEVLGFRIYPGYVSRTDDLYGQVMLAVEAADPAVGHTMCFYGVGDHGGGPTRRNIEWILENRAALDGIELRFSRPEAFFAEVAEHGQDLPLVTTELQHTFPGCYSVMHDVKRAQRRGEHLLERTERLVEGFVEDAAERAELLERLDRGWDDLLFTAFHDILAGTSISSAWESVRALQGRARMAGEEVAVEASRRFARRALPPREFQQVVLINADSDPFTGWIEAEPFLDFDEWGERWLSDVDGTPIPFQAVQADAASLIVRVVFPAALAPRSATQVLVRDDPAPADDPLESDLVASPAELANAHVRVALDPAGFTLDSGARAALHLRRDGTDTWTFHTDRFEEPVEEELHAADGWAVEESGPLRARVRLETTLGSSRVRWTLTLHRDDARLGVRVEVLWGERHRLLQLPLTLPADPVRWTDGLAGGHVERSPGPVEWPVQGWSRVEFGQEALAWLTHDAYSISLDGRRWQWTLLRSPKMAWGGGRSPVYGGRDVFADQGEHVFDLELRAGPALAERDLRAAARRLGQPPLVWDSTEGMERPPWGNRPPRGLWSQAEERALADGHLPELAESRPGPSGLFSGGPGDF
jgi:alpha-mannosidase